MLPCFEPCRTYTTSKFSNGRFKGITRTFWGTDKCRGQIKFGKLKPAAEFRLSPIRHIRWEHALALLLVGGTTAATVVAFRKLIKHYKAKKLLSEEGIKACGIERFQEWEKLNNYERDLRFAGSLNHIKECDSCRSSLRKAAEKMGESLEEAIAKIASNQIPSAGPPPAPIPPDKLNYILKGVLIGVISFAVYVTTIAITALTYNISREHKLKEIENLTGTANGDWHWN